MLVRDGERLGIFTNTGLQRAIVDGRPLDTLPVRDLATFQLVTIAPDAPLFDALALMIQHQVHRLVVADGERIVGLLEQLDLLSFLSNHSYLITVQIAQAQRPGGAEGAARSASRASSRCCTAAAREVGQIGKLVQALNAKLFERTWQLVAPAALLADSCLFVMGSEGRGEQLLKTDQDNGLVLRDGTARATTRWRGLCSASRPRCATSATPTARAASWSATRPGGAARATSPPPCAAGCCGPTPKG